MSSAKLDGRRERLERELAHDRGIAERAEVIWDWQSPAGRERADRRAAFYVERAGLGPDLRALELGCGTGLFTERVARSGATIVGMDLSPDLLDRARARLGAVPNVALLRCDAHRLPFPDAWFDAVYGSSILHHLELETALRETHRVLRPGGCVVFTEPNLLNPQIAFMYLVGPRARFGLSPDEKAFSRFASQQALRGLGYVEIHVTPFDFLHPSTPAVLIPVVARLGIWLEHTPLLREIAGSQLIHARK